MAAVFHVSAAPRHCGTLAALHIAGEAELDALWLATPTSAAALALAHDALACLGPQHTIDYGQPSMLDLKDFTAPRLPDITLPDYLTRLVRYADPGVNSVVMLRVLLERVCQVLRLVHEQLL